MKEPNTISWKLLLRRLKKDKAILLVGPEVIMTNYSSEQQLKEQLQGYIQEDLEDILEDEDLERIEYYSEDGFFFLEDDFRLEVAESVQDFYKKQKLSDIYYKLAELPFHLTISLSPDKLLNKAFEELGLPYHFHFYDKTDYNTVLDDKKLDFTPSKENRLVYNIFGSIDNENSLILSYDDLFEFIQRIFNNYKLPKTIEETLLSANCFVFVGFNYSKWYLKLLLRLMNLNEKVYKVYGTDKPKTKEIETFFINEFDMNFTELDSISFIEALHEKCAEKDMLMKASSGSTNTAAQLPAELVKAIRRLITNNMFKKAFKQLQTYTQENAALKELGDELALIMGRFLQLEKDKMDDVLLPGTYRPTLNRIRRDFSDLINKFS